MKCGVICGRNLSCDAFQFLSTTGNCRQSGIISGSYEYLELQEQQEKLWINNDLDELDFSMVLKSLE